MSKKHNYYGKSSAYQEAFRSLATNIEFSDIDNKVRTLVVTSANPSEGKSTISVNLAATLADRGSKVLLIDCDLRNPSIRKVAGIDSNAGLTNILVNDLDYRAAIVNDDSMRVDYVPTGPLPPNPTEILRSTKMKNFVKEVYDSYDYIILDSPPVGIITDAAIISTYVDGTILVSEYKVTKEAELEQAIANIKQVGGNILGVIINQVDVKSKSSKYYGYY